MTIKDIVVNLSVAEGGSYAGDYAVSVGAALNAHVTGIAFAYDPVVPVASTGYIPPEVIEAQQRDNEAAAKAAIARFSAAAGRDGFYRRANQGGRQPRRRRREFARIARRFDLACGQAEPEQGAVEDLIAEATLFESGGRCRGPLHPEGAAQARPGDGMLGRSRRRRAPSPTRCRCSSAPAGRNRDRGQRTRQQDEIRRGRMGQHLARHGLKVEVNRISDGDIDVADALLSHAADTTDFIVMGGYGHSRLREFVLGGATRPILRSMTVPALMSHESGIRD